MTLNSLMISLSPHQSELPGGSQKDKKRWRNIKERKAVVVLVVTVELVVEVVLVVVAIAVW